MPVKESLMPPITPLEAKLVVLKPKKSPTVDSSRIFSWAGAWRGGEGWRKGARTESHVGMPPGFPTKLLEGIESLTDRGFRFFSGEVFVYFCFGPFPRCACNLGPANWPPAPEISNMILVSPTWSMLQIEFYPAPPWWARWTPRAPAPWAWSKYSPLVKLQ